eukprot:15302501-Heterocapsa_arctica.AAC.1
MSSLDGMFWISSKALCLYEELIDCVLFLGVSNPQNLFAHDCCFGSVHLLLRDDYVACPVVLPILVESLRVEDVT